ncbi:MAG TPA: aldose epimerase family protein [Puia sp.]|nr:aldose epimerase family protein [Puia sp.]
MKLFPFKVIFSILGCLLIGACHTSQIRDKEIVITENGSRKYYGTIGSDSVYAYTIKNNNGLKAVITNYGATLLELWTADRSGIMGDVILGYDSLSGYLQKGNPYFGAIVGRYANRIGHASFLIDGVTYKITANENGNTLHGGLKGFDKVIWTVEQINDSVLVLSYTSHDGEEGFPGNLSVKIEYGVSSKYGNRLFINYTAMTDKKTPVNLTNHAYFNLSAGRDSTILDEELAIYSDKYTVVNKALIPTGENADVKNGPMDFKKNKKIGKDIAQVNGGYDHNFVIERKSDSGLIRIASLYDQGSGRIMNVLTTQPGIQFYTGNFLDGTLTGRNGKKIVKYGGLCLETQHYPDSPNQPSFPNTILEPGQTYNELTVYQFSIKP